MGTGSAGPHRFPVRDQLLDLPARRDRHRRPVSRRRGAAHSWVSPGGGCRAAGCARHPQAGTGSRPAIRAIAVVLCITGVLLPVGLTILVGLSRSRRDVWLYRPAPRWVALLLLPLLVVSATLGLGLATDADSGRYLAVPSLLTAITLGGMVGVLWRRAWARPIAGAAALLMALTVVGLPLASWASRVSVSS